MAIVLEYEAAKLAALTKRKQAIELRREWRFLHEALVKQAEDSITDEQIWRVLAPVLEMIQSGRFDRQLAPSHIEQ